MHPWFCRTTDERSGSTDNYYLNGKMIVARIKGFFRQTFDQITVLPIALLSTQYDLLMFFSSFFVMEFLLGFLVYIISWNEGSFGDIHHKNLLQDYE